MAISSRQAGAIVDCPTCGEKTLVPQDDVFAIPVPVQPISPAPDPAGVSSADSPPVANAPNSQADGGWKADIQREPRESNRNEIDSPELPDEEPFVPSDTGDDDGNGPPPLRRRSNLEEEMDLTPMVDVTFQLLIFFMVSASFSLQKSIEIPTPDPDQKGATQQVQTLDELQGTSILVRIDAANGIWIDDDPLSDVSRLVDTLRDKMRREQKTELLVTADAMSLHRTIIAVIDAANEIGIQKIRMGSKKKSDS